MSGAAALDRLGGLCGHRLVCCMRSATYGVPVDCTGFCDAGGVACHHRQSSTGHLVLGRQHLDDPQAGDQRIDTRAFQLNPGWSGIVRADRSGSAIKLPRLWSAPTQPAPCTSFQLRNDLGHERPRLCLVHDPLPRHSGHTFVDHALHGDFRLHEPAALETKMAMVVDTETVGCGSEIVGFLHGHRFLCCPLAALPADVESAIRPAMFDRHTAKGSNSCPARNRVR